MTTPIQIINLTKEPNHLERLAQWHHQEWSHLNPGLSLADRIEKMQSYLTNDFIPSTFIAKTNNELLGSAALIESDMDTHTEFSPWLASIFVKPGARRQGIGSLLVKHVMKAVRKEGLHRLFLFTPSQESFYVNLGWRTIQKEDYRGLPVTIMSINLASQY